VPLQIAENGVGLDIIHCCKTKKKANRIDDWLFHLIPDKNIRICRIIPRQPLYILPQFL
jgi:hypothetical protein